MTDEKCTYKMALSTIVFFDAKMTMTGFLNLMVYSQYLKEKTTSSGYGAITGAPIMNGKTEIRASEEEFHNVTLGE